MGNVLALFSPGVESIEEGFKYQRFKKVPFSEYTFDDCLDFYDFVNKQITTEEISIAKATEIKLDMDQLRTIHMDVSCSDLDRRQILKQIFSTPESKFVAVLDCLSVMMVENQSCILPSRNIFKVLPKSSKC